MEAVAERGVEAGAKIKVDTGVTERGEESELTVWTELRAESTKTEGESTCIEPNPGCDGVADDPMGEPVVLVVSWNALNSRSESMIT